MNLIGIWNYGNRNRMKKIEKVPNPGSDAAIEKGCTCPRMDNCNGRGAYGHSNWFWNNGDCPIHPTKKPDEMDANK